MKKSFCLILITLMFILSGCNSLPGGQQTAVMNTPVVTLTAVPTGTPMVTGDALLDEYLENIDDAGAVHDYGTSARHTEMTDKLVVGIQYPETGQTFLDDEIKKWMDATIAECKKDAEAHTDTESPAELTVSYESFCVGKNDVGISFCGTFHASYMNDPVDIVKTVNANIKTKKLLTREDVLIKKNVDKLVKLVAKEAGVKEKDTDEHFLDHMLLQEEGITFILKQGDYLPMSEGKQVVTIPYKKLNGFISEEFTYGVEQAATPKPTKKPTKKPTTKPTPKMTFKPKRTPQPDSERVIDPNKPMIALTFDDGPSAHTERLLNLFEEYGGKGTFFVVGNLINSRKSTLRRIADEGHEIGNHSWSHRQLTKLSKQQITDQIMKNKAKIYEVTGIECNIVRPPYGSCNKQVKAVGKELGVSFVNWSIDTLDWKYKNAKRVHNVIMDKAKPGAIILCHDIHKTTVDAMETVIPQLIEEGYQLVTVSELMAYSKTPLKPGQMYYKQ